MDEARLSVVVNPPSEKHLKKSLLDTSTVSTNLTWHSLSYVVYLLVA